MGAEQIRRWESGALAHAVTDPFGQGPLPWLRGSENYFDDTGHVVPWYADPDLRPRDPAGPGPRTADDVHRQIKGFASTGAVAPGEAIDFRITVDPPQQFSRRHLPHRPLRRRRRSPRSPPARGSPASCSRPR